jgi:16S rRNA (cytidine1402-2'-O)-methyltransferase
MPASVFLIGTPLGNLGDLSPRAVETIRSLDILFCEDTRHTAKLLAYFHLAPVLRSLHDDSPEGSWSAAVRLAVDGKRIGYATDAGMPGISDPGRRLLRAAWDAGLTPVVIPGPSAVTTLASYCPFVGTDFHFIGFAPRKAADRSALVIQIRDSPAPSVVFEAPARLHRFLSELSAVLEPERELVIGREMTKLHEQVLLLRAGDWHRKAEQVPALGEFTIAVAAAPARERDLDQQQARSALARLDAAGFSRRDALRALAAAWDVQPNALKRLGYQQE